jgi:hypothetical protein
MGAISNGLQCAHTSDDDFTRVTVLVWLDITGHYAVILEEFLPFRVW